MEISSYIKISKKFPHTFFKKTYRMRNHPIAPIILIAFFLLPLVASVPYAEAQAGSIVTVNPSFVNLGMQVSIAVNPQATGTYIVNVTKPDGITSTQLTYTFTTLGEINNTYGNATDGFNSIIDQTGIYKVSLTESGIELAEATFFATDKLNLDLTVANAGTSDNVCYLSNQFTRGTNVIPRIYVQFASTGEYMTPTNSPTGQVTFTLPNGTLMDTTFAGYLLPEGAYRNCFSTDWDIPTGVWNITAEASDGKGNYGVFVSYPQVVFPVFVLRVEYEILPAPLTITAQVLDTSTGKPATNELKAGQTLSIEATIEYQHPLGPNGREQAEGYLGLLNTTRADVVEAVLGWGFYNETSKTFGGSDLFANPGGLIDTFELTYDSDSGLWINEYDVTGLEPEGDYMTIFTARDKASVANSGTTRLMLATSPETVEVEIVSEVIPVWAYGGMGGLLVVGVIVGVLIRRKP